MTDADVDGAHIRTLILTFFFRHMRELVDAGYVYIAQPPLYRIKIGRNERYVKNDAELEKLLLARSSRRSRSPTATASRARFTETRYTRFAGALREYDGWASRLRAEFGAPAVDYVKDHRLIEEPIDDLDDARVATSAPACPATSRTRVEVVARYDEGDDPSLLVKVTEKRTGAVATVPMPARLLRVSGLRGPAPLAPQAARARRPPAVRGHARPPRTASRRRSRGCARRSSIWPRTGSNLSRFKGLGEMNPDQLWETTMNPETRTLQRVTIDDAQAADEIFTMLMGDKVEPRRDFIEQHARDVKFLDT